MKLSNIHYIVAAFSTSIPSVFGAFEVEARAASIIKPENLNVTHLLAEATNNLSSIETNVQPVSINGSVAFDWQGKPMPLPKFNYTVDHSQYVNTSAYQRCATAVNCQPVHHANGWRHSFKPGYNATHPYGNGTLSRHISNDLEKRQSSGGLGTVEGTTAPTTLFYGTTNPCTAFNNAYYICGESSCESSTQSISTNYLANDGGDPYLSTGTIVISATGNYPTYNMRNFLIGAIVTAAGQGQTWSSANLQNNEDVWTGTGFDDITVALYQDTYLEASLTISNTWQPAASNDDCSNSITTITDVIKTFTKSIFGNLLAGVDTWVCSF